ncbi:hypothetical protein RE6C_04384 [Rhodopirellula europaea 6C]|uniref:Uncharacterized protein n=1 Tax=Rhodopirellula europaea 6C TaxID=1263867 RepID=M2A4X1_9BACT|nr:hypothetical protein RE6C_04384 [Rhodopirellula europaea 6C]
MAAHQSGWLRQIALPESGHDLPQSELAETNDGPANFLLWHLWQFQIRRLVVWRSEWHLVARLVQ